MYSNNLKAETEVSELAIAVIVAEPCRWPRGQGLRTVLDNLQSNRTTWVFSRIARQIDNPSAVRQLQELDLGFIGWSSRENMGTVDASKKECPQLRQPTWTMKNQKRYIPTNVFGWVSKIWCATRKFWKFGKGKQNDHYFRRDVNL